jgi:hypothetical protein
VPVDVETVFQEPGITDLERDLVQARHGETAIAIRRAVPDDEEGPRVIRLLVYGIVSDNFDQ